LLVLDQFPRQIWRDQARAFAGDGLAQALTLRALEAGWVEAEPAPQRRPFWLMPLMHSEDLALRSWVCPCSSATPTPAPPSSPAATMG
jgi:uncharacterized protein (DUF924 family)